MTSARVPAPKKTGPSQQFRRVPAMAASITPVAFGAAELGEMGWSKLKRLAESHGLTEEQIDRCLEQPKPKVALIELLSAGGDGQHKEDDALGDDAPAQDGDGTGAAASRALLQCVARTTRLEQRLREHDVSVSFLLRTWEQSEEGVDGSLQDRLERAEGRERILANMLRSAEMRGSVGQGGNAESRMLPEPEPEPEPELEHSTVPRPVSPPVPPSSLASRADGSATDEEGREGGSDPVRDEHAQSEDFPQRVPPWLAAGAVGDATVLAKLPALAMAASAAMKRGDLHGAVERYSDALGCIPCASTELSSDLRCRVAALYNSRAGVLFELGRFREALRDSDASVIADTNAFANDRQPQLRAALCCLRLGELRESRRRFEELEDPELPFWRHLCTAEEVANAAAGALRGELRTPAEWRRVAEQLLGVCESLCPEWVDGWTLRTAALCSAGEWEAGAESAHGGMKRFGEHPDLLVLLGRCAVRLHGQSRQSLSDAPRYWEHALRLDPDAQDAAGLLKAYRRAASGGGKVGMAVEEAVRTYTRHRMPSPILFFGNSLWRVFAVLQVVAEERRQGAMSRDASDSLTPPEPSNASLPQRANAGTKKKQTDHQQRQQQTLGEKQAVRVEALRSAQSSEAEMASARAHIAADITVELDARVRGKSLRQALEEFGVPVARDVPESDAIPSAYKKALAKFHPDRAMQKGLSLRAQVEAEETYKLILNLHEAWTKNSPQQPDIDADPFAATAASRRNATDTPSWSSAAGHAYGAGRRTGAGARPRSAGANARNAARSGKWSAGQAQGQRQHQVCVAPKRANRQSASPKYGTLAIVAPASSLQVAACTCLTFLLIVSHIALDSFWCDE